ncbi:class I SAM-dependent methyltransferase [candidate division KSB1 bacterium]|nr:class I SAM-dependent methyltransferase [candidate division KSB1 bacterium]
METQNKIDINLDVLLNEPPLVHKGGSLVWGLAEDVLRYLDETLKPDAKTLETGCGMSTILFAVKSKEHTCIEPDENGIRLIHDYCRKKNISLDHVHFIADFSQNVLPGLERKNLDLVLIDGGHGYPIPAIDWLYTAPMLKNGGVVIIDDVHLWTGLELKRFLKNEDAWEHIREFSRASVFKKVGQEYLREWKYQPYIASKSRLPRKINHLKISMQLLIKGNFSQLIRKVRKQLSR